MYYISYRLFGCKCKKGPRDNKKSPSNKSITISIKYPMQCENKEIALKIKSSP